MAFFLDFTKKPFESINAYASVIVGLASDLQDLKSALEASSLESQWQRFLDLKPDCQKGLLAASLPIDP